MRICIVTHKLQKGDGQGRVNYEVACEALRAGHQLVLVASAVDDELANNPNVQVSSIKVNGWPTELVRNIIFSSISTRWLRKNCSRFDILLINGAITRFPADFNAVHFVHSSWLRSPVHTFRESITLYGFYQWFYTWVNGIFEKKAFQKSKLMIAVSNQVAKELETAGVSAHSIATITNGVDLEEFSPGNIQRQCLDIPERVPLALFVGDIRTSRKNLDLVLSALVDVPDLHVAIAGSTENSPYPEMAKSLKVEGRTHFLGYRKDISTLMKAADFLIYPSHYDPFGLVVLEAMASGLAVVTARSAGASELVTPDIGFVLRDSNDRDALVDAMRALSSDSNLRSQMGAGARKVAQSLSWQSMAREYVRLFEDFYSKQSTYEEAIR